MAVERKNLHPKKASDRMLKGLEHQLTIAHLSFDTAWLHVPGGDDLPLPLIEAERCAVGDVLRVFVYADRDGQPVATTRQPRVRLDACACLKVTAVEAAGAFLDWGLDKDLLLPFAEQRRPVAVGQRESVLVYLDNSGRLAATSRLDHHLTETPDGFKPWQPVSLLVFQRTDLGFKAVIDDRATGLLYKDDVFQALKTGQRVDGYIRRIRTDGRIDLTLQPRSDDLQEELCRAIVERLEADGGSNQLIDKSLPEVIHGAFGVSKKNYKRALGTLYRRRIVRIDPDRITLLR